MQLVDRIEKRRFVGREFLLWLWFESELFDATLQTMQHGAFGLWLEKRLVLSGGAGSTRVTAPMPGLGREAKEALLRDRLPESAGVRIALDDAELSFALTADTLAVSGFKVKVKLAQDAEHASTAPAPEGEGEPLAPMPAVETGHDAFYERMRMTAVLEQLLETLYGEFLVLRLSADWAELVVPLMKRWAQGHELDVARYEALRRPPPRAQSEVIELTPDEAEALVELVDDADPFDELEPRAALGS